MISFRCMTERYDDLYARYLANPGTLLDLAGYKPGMRLLDLCGGTGPVSREAVRRGAPKGTVYLLDLNPRCNDHRIISVKADANTLTKVRPEDIPLAGFDVIIIRQSIAYLEVGEALGWSLALFLRSGGRLVFNTFDWPKEARPWVTKEYTHEGHEFFEAAIKIFGRVLHVQHRWGLGSDLTFFRNYKLSDFILMVQKYFDYDIHEDGNSRRWVCYRRRGRRG